MSVRTLLILGNGFDRNCGINSTFNGFVDVETKPFTYYKYYFNNNPYTSIKNAKQDQYDIKNDLNRLRHEFQFINEGNHRKSISRLNGVSQIDNSQTFEYVIDGNKYIRPGFYNFWVLYLSLLKGITIPSSHISWNNIEGQIASLCDIFERYENKDLFIDKNGNYISIIYLFHLFMDKSTRNQKVDIFYKNLGYEKPEMYINEFVYNMPYHKKYHANILLSMAIIVSFEYCNLERYISLYNTNNDYDQIFYNFLFYQLKIFRDKFARYLKENIHKVNFINSKHDHSYYFSRREKGLKKLCNLPYNLLTFNYTGEPNDSYCIKYLPIHSDFNHHPIIGINDNRCRDNNDDKKFVTFSKRCQIIEQGPDYPNRISIDDIIPLNINCIKIYGHSLSEDDFPYFKKIFDNCNLESNKIKLIFYFTNYKGASPNHGSIFRRNVYKFMDKYKKGIANQLFDHHKLQICLINW